ncbi:hypothetical protein Tco_1334451 [Tanacetum coccineum]
MALPALTLRATLPQTNNQLRTSSKYQKSSNYTRRSVVVQNVQGRQIQNQRGGILGGEMYSSNGSTKIELGSQCNGSRKTGQVLQLQWAGSILQGTVLSPKRPHNSDYCKDKIC